MPKYPEVEVELTGEDGNAFNIMGKVCKALRDYGCPSGEIEQYLSEAMAGDYDHLLQTTMKWVNVV